MNTSWEEYFTALENLRKAQEEFFRRKNPSSFNAAKKRERLVDNIIKKKNAEPVRQIQPELI